MAAVKDKKEQAKLLIAGFMGLATVAMLALVAFPEWNDELTRIIDSVIPHSSETLVDAEPRLGKQNEVQSSTERGRKAEETLETLTAESPSGLDLLSEELVQDSLWEEGIVSSRAEGVRSGQAVLDALHEMEGWSPTESGYSPTLLRLYLRYPKLWVRVAAYAFAVKAGVLTSSEEAKLARLIALKFRENPSQIARFLIRYEESDPELHARLRKNLLETGAETPEEPLMPELEEIEPAPEES